MTSLKLIEQIRSGARLRAAQGELYDLVRATLLERLRRKIPARLQSRLDAEDVLHEAYLRAIASLDQFRPASESSFFAWVYSIARNLITDTGRRRSVAAVHFAREEGDAGPRASRFAARKGRGDSDLGRRDWIEAVLEQLGDREAQVIRLRRLEGYTFAEIAASWEKTPAAVQRFYSRTWKKFCALARQGEG